MRVAVKIKFGINEKNVSFSAEPRPEIGAADGTADHERWQKMDFVVGIALKARFTGGICIIHTTN